MSITLIPSDATLGACVRDVDLANLDDVTWREIYAAFLEYGVLAFPGQHLSEADQGAFATRFGDTEKLSPRQKGPTIQFSNKKPDGSLVAPGEEAFNIMKGNEGWHTDSTYMPLASKVAMLAALVVPPEGGETEFADMRAAWDALDDETKARLEPLSAYHSLYYSQGRAGFRHKTDNMYGFHDKGAPFRPIVKIHPETGRKSLYTGRHAYGLPGMSDVESERLLDKLLEDACQPPRVFRHVWSVGDLVVWDNRCLMHRARPYDPKHPRALRASRISGDPASELAPTFADTRASSYKPTSSNISSLAR
ncbi:MAG: TauD/TfdA family dioxygenase [Proteobacteria bacterium]|nr:TauD/TfdA family dioxygenase [Pseudomonadota bacterium]